MSIKRTLPEQNKHDEEIRRREAFLKEKGFSVKTNPGITKDNCVIWGNDKIYPDLYTHLGDEVKDIFEVETENTINTQASEQWVVYASFPCNFYLVVPVVYRTEAERILREQGISVAGILTY